MIKLYKGNDGTVLVDNGGVLVLWPSMAAWQNADNIDASDFPTFERDRGEEPDDYGFEFVSDPDDPHGPEGDRTHYYMWRYPQDKLPEGMTPCYIVGPETAPGCDCSEVYGYYAALVDVHGDVSSREDHDLFDTVAECVAWLNERIGGLTPIIKLEVEKEAA